MAGERIKETETNGQALPGMGRACSMHILLRFFLLPERPFGPHPPAPGGEAVAGLLAPVENALDGEEYRGDH